MSLIRPFAGLRPTRDHAGDVAAPPYDVVTTAEARALARDRPWSFLHISRAEIDLPQGTDPYAPEVYAKAAENLARMEAQGILQRDSAPCYYLYRLMMREHCQIGLVAAASVAAYEANRICKHELTRPDKEDDRVRQIDALNAQTGPVLLTYRAQAAVDEVVEAVTRAAPEIDLVADDGVRHSLWPIADPDTQQRLSAAFGDIDRLYIADGHHRSAAAARVAAMRRRTNSPVTGDQTHDYFLAVIFPDNQMQIMAYNRVVQDLNGLSVEAFLTRVGRTFAVAPSVQPVQPARAGEFGMYLAGHWYRLTFPADRIPRDPVAQLDVSLLADNLIAPVLGIRDQRRDKRIDFVGGIRGLTALAQRVDSGEMAVAFALFPTTMGELMAVADADEIMPPKSTWFEPKLADGLVSHVLD